MIIACSEELEPNKIYTHENLKGPFSCNDEMYYEYRFMCLRVATFDEYLYECRDLGYTDAQIADYVATRRYFYQVSLD